MASLFSGNVNVVQGDYEDLTPSKNGLAGHTRLFSLVQDLDHIPVLKGKITMYAFAAGIRQVVDLSSSSLDGSWRENYIGYNHSLAEEVILRIPNRGDVVTLRPGHFMTNIFGLHKPIDEFVLDV